MTTILAIVIVCWLGVRVVRLLGQVWRLVRAEIFPRIGAIAPA
jgi:hypothetical protein